MSIFTRMSEFLVKSGAANKSVSEEMYDVIVVGGGVSGLHAAYQLLANAPDLKVLVLEAKDRVGGRTLTTQMKSADGLDSFDLGGQWVSNTQKHIMNLLLELGIDTYPQYETGTKVLMLDDGTIKRYENFIPNVSWLSLLDLQWFLYKFERLSRDVDVDRPYDHPRAAELDATSFETYKQKHVYTEVTKQLLDISVRTALGCEAKDISVLFILSYARAAGGLMRLLEISNGGAQEQRVQVLTFSCVEPSRLSVLCLALLQKSVSAGASCFLTQLMRRGDARERGDGRMRIKGGCLQISETMAEKIGWKNIKLSTAVDAIYQHPDVHGNYSVGVLTHSQDLLVSKYVILAIPLHLAAGITFEPSLPEKRLLLMKNMPVGHMTKVIVTYAEAFWRTKGFSGEVVSSGGPKMVEGCEHGPLGVFFDATSCRGNPALVGFLAGDQGIQWMSKPLAMRKLAILRDLAKCFGDEALQPLEYKEKNWSEEPYNGGCPVNLGAPGTMKYMNEQFRNPFLRVHWAGTETATSWTGYLNGAVQAGSRAAKEVLFHLRPLTLTAKDLLDTVYGQRTKTKQTSSTKRWRKLVYYLAILATLFYIFFYMIQPTH